MRAGAVGRSRSSERPFYIACLMLAAAALVIAGSNSYILTIAITAAIWYLVVSALNLVVGYSGQFSAGHAALFGVGAYGAALAEIHWGVPPALSLIPSLAIAGLASMLVSFPLNRLRGPFLAMATFALQLAFTELLLKGSGLTGGANGLAAPDALTWNGKPLLPFVFLVLLVLTCLVVTVLLYHLLRLRAGRALRAISADETMAETLGIRIGRYRSAAFTASGCIAALGGYWQLQYVGFIDPTLFDLPASIAFLAVLVVGGRGSLAGPLFGVVFYYLSHTALATVPTLEALLYGGLVILAVRYAPRGLAGLARSLWLLYRSGSDPSAEAIEAGELDALSESSLTDLPTVRRDVSLPDPSGSAAMAALEVDSVAKSYGGVEVLREVSFSVRSGSVTGLIGPNGAGKTTLLNIVNGLSDFDRGGISVCGTALPRTADPLLSAQLGVGRTFQVPRLVDSLSVTENVMLGHHRHMHGTFVHDLLSAPVSRREDRRVRALSDEILGSLGLSRIARLPVGRLTHGLRRFVEIARAIAGEPRVLLLDEPGAGLEPFEIDYLMRLLTHVNSQLSLSMLIVDHNMRLVMGCSSQVVVLHSGTVIKSGTPEDVRADEAVVDAYLGTTAAQLKGA